MERRASSSSAACRQRTRQTQQRFPLSADATISGCSRGFLTAVSSESGNNDVGVLKRGGPLRHLNCTSEPDVYIPPTAASVIRASADWQPKPHRRPRPAHRRTPNLSASATHSSSVSLNVRPTRRASTYANIWCSGQHPREAISSVEGLVVAEPTSRRFEHARQDAVLPIAINSTRRTSLGELDDFVQRGIDTVLGPSISEMTEEPSFVVLPRRHLRSLHGLGISDENLRKMLQGIQDSHTNMDQVADRFRNWRLDIDVMSYEELVDLGNEIGHVKTGLKEDEVSIYVEKMNECTLEREGRCSICLEEYCNLGKDIVKLECGHEYHACCIKKWLQQKSLCPICKCNVVHL